MKHMNSSYPSSLCKNNTHVLLLCEFEELIVEDLSWPKDVDDFLKTRCVESLQFLQIMHSHSLTFQSIEYYRDYTSLHW